MRKTFLMSYIAAFLTAGLILAVTWAFEFSERERFEQQTRNTVLSRINVLATEIEESINRKLFSAQGLITYISAINPEINQAEFDQIAEALFIPSTGIFSFKLYQQNQILYIYPNLSKSLSEAEVLALNNIAMTKQTVVAGPLLDEDKHNVLIIFIPIILNKAHSPTNNFWGVAGIFIDSDSFFKETGLVQNTNLHYALLATNHNNLQYALIGRDGLGAAGGLFFGSVNIFRNRPVLTDVSLPSGGSWRIAAVPSHGWPDSAPISLWLWVVGTILAMFAGILVYLLVSAPVQLRMAIQQATQQISVLNQAYGRFVPEQFLKLLDKKSVVDITLGDQVEKNMTVLFSDIRNFTHFSEKMKPKETFDFINRYLGIMEPIVVQHNGFIDKYIGDAIMALFPKKADDALQCAIKMLKALHEYHTIISPHFSLNIGIGLNSGQLMLGIVGGNQQMDTTVIADAVNLASRVENLTKYYQVPLLITDHTFKKLVNPNVYKIRVIGNVKVKGKQQAVTIYEVFDADIESIALLKQQTLDLFNQAFEAFQQKMFVKALGLFKQVLLRNIDDNVARIYCNECANTLKTKGYFDESLLEFSKESQGILSYDENAVITQTNPLLSSNTLTVKDIHSNHIPDK